MNREERIERYRTGMAVFEDALAGITEEELDRPQPDGEWTVRQIVHHLADGEAMSYTRLRRLVADDEPVMQSYNEPVFAQRLHYDRPIATSLAVTRAVREASLELMAVMTPAEWAKTGTHTEHPSYSVDFWLELYSEHPREHADQIRRARATPA